MRDKKLAVVLLNLGCPLSEADIKPFLFNFFMDKNIIGAPKFIRYLLAKHISRKRGEGAAKKAYAHLGGKSPLLDNTKAQAKALEEALKKDLPNVKVFVSMRYWHPLAEEVIKEIEAFAPDKTILLPLYPQYSTATTKSSLEDFHARFKGECSDITNYFDNNGFIAASADLIREEIAKAPAKFRLLFSAHGLPERTVKKGDPYQTQCELSAQAIVKALGVENLDWSMCYQSRVGCMKWIKPSIADELARAAKDGVGVIIYPVSFVSEHVETLVELDIEYKHLAKELGIKHFARVPTVSCHAKFIAGLKEMVLHLYSI